MTDPDGDLEWAAPDQYPRMWNMSAAFKFHAIVRPITPEPPEYVSVRLRRGDIEAAIAVATWNTLWESAQFRRRLFDEDELPGVLGEIADKGDNNIVFVPRTRSRYYEYAPLFHLLPRSTVERHGLQLMNRGQWPFAVDHMLPGEQPPADFQQRLARAWAAEVWRYLMPGSKMRGFTATDPVKLLAHNLDFWIPPVTAVMEDILRDLPEVDNGVAEETPMLVDGTPFVGAVMGNPRMGSDLWRGEVEALDTISWVVDEADRDGHLRGILDAVRSNRVEDDFSDCWTFAREDFERKLHKKRSKVSVRFVELTDTIPVQGPETQVVGDQVVADFVTLLNEKDRQVVVVLNSGVTRLTDAADILGYANHSAISKRLKKIRIDAQRYFDGV